MTIIVFALLYIPWLFSGMLFPVTDFYTSLKLPNYVIPGSLVIDIWLVIYALITFTFFILLCREKLDKHYLFTYIVNYILNSSVSMFMFHYQDLHISLINIFLLFISTFSLFLRTRKKALKLSYNILAYLIIVFYFLIVMFNIYLIN